MEDLSSKVPTTQSNLSHPTSAGKENHQNHTHHLQKDRAWQEELLGAFLPQVQEEKEVDPHFPKQQDTQAQAQAQAQAPPEEESTKSKIIVFSDSNANEKRIAYIIKLSVIVSLFTAIMLWFFEPSFVQSVNTQHLLSTGTGGGGGADEKDVFFDVNGDVYVSSRSKIIFWSFLSGVFAFMVLYSIPHSSSFS